MNWLKFFKVILIATVAMLLVAGLIWWLTGSLTVTLVCLIFYAGLIYWLISVSMDAPTQEGKD